MSIRKAISSQLYICSWIFLLSMSPPFYPHIKVMTFPDTPCKTEGSHVRTESP